MLLNRVPTPRCAFELHFGLFKIKTMKQETLEEAAFNYAKSLPKAIGDLENIVEMYKRYSFVDGAKWQQERSYSEEEVLEILASYADWDIRDWFNKYKKIINYETN